MPPLAPHWGPAADPVTDPATATHEPVTVEPATHDPATASLERATHDPATASLEPATHDPATATLEPTLQSHAQPAAISTMSPPATGVDLAYDLVLVGGVPGAGKTTAIAHATDDLDHVRAIDPEHVICWLRSRLPDQVPYRAYRWLVHFLHTLRVVLHLLNGPVAGRRLVVHDPGTRLRRRSIFLALAHLAGWRAVLLYVDVDRSAAQNGQLQRGRVVRSFEEHWQSWQHLRPTLDAAARELLGTGGPESTGSRGSAGTDPVLLVERTDAADVLRRLCAG